MTYAHMYVPYKYIQLLLSIQLNEIFKNASKQTWVLEVVDVGCSSISSPLGQTFGQVIQVPP